VGDRLRPANPRADQAHAARQPLVANPRFAEECRRLDRHLARPGGAGRQGGELVAHRSLAQVRADGALLRAEEGVLREEMGAAGRRENRRIGRKWSKTMKVTSLVIFVLMAATSALAESPSVPVTVDNFARAESDLYMGNAVKDGGFGKFHHNREPVQIDKQFVIRANRDTLYSSGVFDLDAGPVTIRLPDAGNRFRSMQV